ncbi:MAG: condensation domain-containing protein [Actinomycetota bacterium]|nr:condensation domain-containing protein [Actinomycetota bacterium]
MSKAPGFLPTLPFNAVDEAVRLLDSPTEPWSIQLELRVSGRLDESRLRAALGQALARHPMIRARQLPANARDRQYCWEITPEPNLDPLRVIECPDDDALALARADLYSLSVPLAESPPLRVRLVRHPAGDLVMLNVNHAAFDGFGCLRVLHSTARAYARTEDPLPDIELTAARRVQSNLATNDLRTRARRLAGVAQKLGDLALAPARIVSEQGSDRPGYGFYHTSLSAEQTQTLSTKAHGGTINDVLVAALNLAITGWNCDHGTGTDRISIIVPVNFRPRQWREEMAVNYVLMTWVTTTATDRRSPKATLEAVAAQTKSIKTTGRGTTLVEVLALSPRLPLWAKQSLSPLLRLTGSRLIDTAQLSNLGQLDSAPSFGPDHRGVVFSTSSDAVRTLPGRGNRRRAHAPGLPVPTPSVRTRRRQPLRPALSSRARPPGTRRHAENVAARRRGQGPSASMPHCDPCTWLASGRAHRRDGIPASAHLSWDTITSVALSRVL